MRWRFGAELGLGGPGDELGGGGVGDGLGVGGAGELGGGQAVEFILELSGDVALAGVGAAVGGVVGLAAEVFHLGVVVAVVELLEAGEEAEDGLEAGEETILEIPEAGEGRGLVLKQMAGDEGGGGDFRFAIFDLRLGRSGRRGRRRRQGGW